MQQDKRGGWDAEGDFALAEMALEEEMEFHELEMRMCWSLCALQSSSDLAATPEAPSVLFENPLQSWVEPPGRFSVPLSWGSLMSLQDLEFLKLASSVNSLCQPCFPLNLLIPSN